MPQWTLGCIYCFELWFSPNICPGAGLLDHILAIFLVFSTSMLLLFSCSIVSDSFRPHGLQHARLPCPIPSPRVCNSCPLSQWCHPTISFSVTLFSHCPQSFPASGSFPMSQFFISGGQSIRVSASTSVLPMNIQCWYPLGLTGLISLLSKGLLRVFSITVWKHQFFSAQPSLLSNFHICTVWFLFTFPINSVVGFPFLYTLSSIYS